MDADHSSIRKSPARLVLTEESSDHYPAVFHRETPLDEIADKLGHQRYVIATDDTGRIAGFASQQQIRNRLNSTNHFERTRWEQMPLRSLINVPFSTTGSQPDVPTQENLRCVAITENDQLFGISVDDDVFLSWNRIESMLSVALSDPLTGLPNRLSYERRVSEEWNRAFRTNMSIAVVVIDLNEFKLVNDTYGHIVGDRVLTSVAHQLESSMRSYDVVARLGGDEFVALCLGCAPGQIAIPVQRIQESLSQVKLNVDGQMIHPQVSIGAAVRHSNFGNTTPCELFAAADDCLYRAKECSDSAWVIEMGLNNQSEPRRLSEVFDELPCEPTDTVLTNANCR